ncbi:MAG: hypothetical protein AVDCRST_MAG71-1113 [uncultured Lysobacter sp.]|uniref:Peptidase M15C domain-containing protein n=1 Tax=uncultured Lysobacter sp. TaxID=271060 RepID=A0A6J4KWS0_9GAMM|nr:MAG: hypothetical protein AVDCRST_MAG71-1113 [uncultured Lysobacter sp.]
MASRPTRADVLFSQRLLRAQGLYRAALDGIWGSESQAAQRMFEQRSIILRERLGAFDARSETSIASLTLATQEQARRFLARVLVDGVDVRIVSGTRSYAEQNALYRQGRDGRRGPIVTQARAGRSTHNFGVAWDVAVFAPDGRYSTRDQDYERVARRGLSPALEWGGHWPRFPDGPHYQLATGLDITALRRRFEAGIGWS